MGSAAVEQALRGIPPLAFSCEAHLHDAVGDALRAAGIAYVHEARRTDRDRPDFVAGDVAIEVKIGGSLSEVTRQVHRYAGLDGVEAVVLVTTRARHRALPAWMQETPVSVVYLSPLGGL